MTATIALDRAISVVRARALLFMTSNVEIRRPTKPVFDIDTGRASSGASSLIFEGPARFWEVTQATSIIVSEDSIDTENTQMSIQWDSSPVPVIGDLAKVTASDDFNMVGRVFWIRSMAKSGLLRPTRRFNVTMVEEGQDV